MMNMKTEEPLMLLFLKGDFFLPQNRIWNHFFTV